MLLQKLRSNRRNQQMWNSTSPLWLKSGLGHLEKNRWVNICQVFKGSCCCWWRWSEESQISRETKRKLDRHSKQVSVASFASCFYPWHKWAVSWGGQCSSKNLRKSTFLLGSLSFFNRFFLFQKVSTNLHTKSQYVYIYICISSLCNTDAASFKLQVCWCLSFWPPVRNHRG